MTKENSDMDLCAKPKQIAENFAQKSMPAKVSYGKVKTLILAIAAGAFIGFGAQASLTAKRENIRKSDFVLSHL